MKFLCDVLVLLAVSALGGAGGWFVHQEYTGPPDATGLPSTAACVIENRTFTVTYLVRADGFEDTFSKDVMEWSLDRAVGRSLLAMFDEIKRRTDQYKAREKEKLRTPKGQEGTPNEENPPNIPPTWPGTKDI